MPVKVSARGIHKNYGAVTALNGVSVDVNAGEVHAICGDNGAGESTLIKILAGVEQPDAGEIVIDGTSQPRDAGCGGGGRSRHHPAHGREPGQSGGGGKLTADELSHYILSGEVDRVP